jgi:serine/threonine protein kinase
MVTQKLASVIAYLSSKEPGIIHYDLKPQNIIFSSGQLKVLDFGICKTIDS